MKFINYFHSYIDYPKDIAINPLPINVLYNFVSVSFLNGFINYVKPIKAFVLCHYYKWNEPIDHTISIQNPPNSCYWIKKRCKTKSELYNTLIIPGITFHVNCDIDFQDDVVILAKTGSIDGKSCYFIFYYDRDCSDCSIGRFVTLNHENEVIKDFNLHINSLDYIDKPQEIPLHYFQGWIKG